QRHEENIGGAQWPGAPHRACRDDWRSSFSDPELARIGRSLRQNQHGTAQPVRSRLQAKRSSSRRPLAQNQGQRYTADRATATRRTRPHRLLQPARLTSYCFRPATVESAPDRFVVLAKIELWSVLADGFF